MARPGIALLVVREWGGKIFTKEMLTRLGELGDLTPLEKLPETWTEDLAREAVRGARVAVTSWGSVAMTEDVLAAAPALGLGAPSAGSGGPRVSAAGGG